MTRPAPVRPPPVHSWEELAAILRAPSRAALQRDPYPTFAGPEVPISTPLRKGDLVQAVYRGAGLCRTAGAMVVHVAPDPRGIVANDQVLLKWDDLMHDDCFKQRWEVHPMTAAVPIVAVRSATGP